MSKGKVVIIGSNATRIEIKGGTGPTGQYLNETVVPAMAFLDAGYDVVLATPNGSKPHIDEASDSAVHFGGDKTAYRKAKDFWASHPSMNPARTLKSVIEGGLENITAVFFPGGQGPVVDLMQDSEVGQILRYFHTNGKPTAMLCHGPISAVAAMPEAKAFRAALAAGDEKRAAELAKGWQYAGYHMTIFSNSEEKWIERDILHGDMLFHVVDALQIAGATVNTTPVDFEPYVLEDRELITGQNPRSDHLISKKLLEVLERSAVPA